LRVVEVVEVAELVFAAPEPAPGMVGTAVVLENTVLELIFVVAEENMGLKVVGVDY
jgi:hypothetical protein